MTELSPDVCVAPASGILQVLTSRTEHPAHMTILFSGAWSASPYNRRAGSRAYRPSGERLAVAYARGPLSDQERLVARCRLASASRFDAHRFSLSIVSMIALARGSPLVDRLWAIEQQDGFLARQLTGRALLFDLVPGMNSARYSQKRSFRDAQYTVSCANAARRRRSPVGLPALGAPARTSPPTCSGLS